MTVAACGLLKAFVHEKSAWMCYRAHYLAVASVAQQASWLLVYSTGSAFGGRDAIRGSQSDWRDVSGRIRVTRDKELEDQG